MGLAKYEQGERDGQSWRWYLKLLDGRKFDIEGSCDYTGWDCQSSLKVKEIND